MAMNVKFCGIHSNYKLSFYFKNSLHTHEICRAYITSCDVLNQQFLCCFGSCHVFCNGGRENYEGNAESVVLMISRM